MNSVCKPTVSVCVATYNQERYIKDCLLSVLAQAYDVTLEVLVGDDASTDNTPEIIKDIAGKYPDIVKFFEHDENLGGCVNYQFLIERSIGDYIAHLDGDDFWMPGKLAEQVQFLEKNSDCVAVYSNAVLINESKDIIGAFNTPQPQRISIDYLLEKGNFLNHSSVLYREHLRNLILDFTDIFLDYRINLRFASKGNLGYINQMLVAYRVNAIGSTMANPNDKITNAYVDAIVEAVEQNNICSHAYKEIQIEWYMIAWQTIVRRVEFSSGFRRMQMLKSRLPVQSHYLIIHALFRAIIKFIIRLPLRASARLFHTNRLYIFTKR